MRIWIAAALAAASCSSSVPNADGTALSNVLCETVGQGIAFQAGVDSVLDVGQHVQIDVVFVDDSTVEQVTGGETWTCGEWSEVLVDGVTVGCGRDDGQPAQAQLDYHHDSIISAGTLPIPPLVAATPRVFAASPSTDAADGNSIEADCTSP